MPRPYKNLNLTKEWLENEYLNNNLSCKSIGKSLNVTETTIRFWLKKFNIPIRTPKQTYENKRIKITKDDLIRLYVNDKMTTTEIGKLYNTSDETIRTRLKQNGIQTREQGYKRKELTKEWLENEYKTKSISQISREIGIKGEIIDKRMVELGINKKMIEHTITSYKMEKNANWKGGKSYEPYCKKFDEQLRESIRNKFNRKCFLCDTTETIHKHSIHHIDYNKNTLCNGKEWPLIPLCHKCHTKTNHNRWYWFNLLINYWAGDKTWEQLNL